MSVLDELLALEKGFWRSAGHPEYYREHLASDPVFALPAPTGILGERALLEAVETAAPWEEFRFQDLRTIVLGEDARALVYKARGTRPGAPAYEAIVSSVYVRADNEWKLVLHQQTPTS